MSFIENACTSANESPHIIIVGSYADLFKSPREIKEKSSLLESIAERVVINLNALRFLEIFARTMI